MAALVGTPGLGAVLVVPEVGGPVLGSPGPAEGVAGLDAAPEEEPLGEGLVRPGVPPMLAAGLEPARALGEPPPAGLGPVLVELPAAPFGLAPPLAVPPPAAPELPAGPATGVLVALGGDPAPTPAAGAAAVSLLPPAVRAGGCGELSRPASAACSPRRAGLAV